jgi:type IV secretion system protein VirB4
MGLNEKEVQVLRYATPKKHYLYHSPLGRRLFDMTLGRAALSFVGATSREEIRRIQELVQTYGEQWPAVWLRHRGCTPEATW